jgi:hypothetical protein
MMSASADRANPPGSFSVNSTEEVALLRTARKTCITVPDRSRLGGSKRPSTGLDMLCEPDSKSVAGDRRMRQTQPSNRIPNHFLQRGYGFVRDPTAGKRLRCDACPSAFPLSVNLAVNSRDVQLCGTLSTANLIDERTATRLDSRPIRFRWLSRRRTRLTSFETS